MHTINEQNAFLPGFGAPSASLRRSTRLRHDRGHKITQILAVLLLVLSLPAATAQLTHGDYHYTSDGSEITLTYYAGPGGAISLPGSINGLPVTTLRGSFCSQNNTLTSVTIPDNVTQIGDSAFSQCSHLASVSFPASLTSIGTGAFSRCERFAAYTVDPGNSDFSSLQGILFNKDKSTLIDCPTTKGGNYSIPSTVSHIADFAFDTCTQLNQVTVPSSVSHIGKYAFLDCSSLTSASLSPGLITIGEYAFFACKQLANITIPGSVQNIEEAAFSRCWGLTEVTLSPGVSSIGHRAFFWTRELNSVSIPASVTHIGEHPFGDGEALTEITVHADNPAYCSVDGVLFSKNKVLLVGYPAEKPGNYTIPASVQTIGSSAFHSCNLLTSMDIPGTVDVIGDDAFHNCANLSNVSLSVGLSSIGKDAFSGCNLSIIHLPSTLTHIMDEAFQGSGLSSITIPDRVEYIGKQAFYNSGLNSVYFAGNAPTVLLGAFSFTSATLYRLEGALGWPAPGEYFAGRPTALWVIPNTAQWSLEPYAIGPGAVRMVAAPVSNQDGASYFFEEHSGGGSSSGWQSGRSYVDLGLASDNSYAYSFLLQDPADVLNATPRSSRKTVSLHDGDLGQALDTTGLVFESNGAQPWFGQATFSHDGVDAAQSGWVSAGQASRLQVSITGPGVLEFYWRLDAHPADAALRFTMDGTAVNGMVADNTWQPEAVVIPLGMHTLSWDMSVVKQTQTMRNIGLIDQLTWSSDAATRSPSGDLAHGNSQPQFEWATMAGATWHQLYITHKGKQYHSSWIEGRSDWTSAQDMPCGDYAWWVRSWGPALGFTPWRGRMDFSIPCCEVSHIQNTEPDGGYISSSTVEYSWDADLCASWYQLYVSRNNGQWLNKWYHLDQAGEISLHVPGHSYGSYRWWIRGWGSDGIGAWSDASVFTYGIPQTQNPEGAAGSPADFMWEEASLSDAQWYEIAVYQGSQVRFRSWIPRSETQLSGSERVYGPLTLASGSYTWWMRAWSNNTIGPWSQGLDFTIQ